MRSVILFCVAGLAVASDYAWQDPQCTVLPTGDLQLRQQPYSLQTGSTVRYIDFSSGNDTAEGSRSHPWKHHPWDPAASANAKEHRGISTYIFKGGVVYRGSMVVRENGSAAEPIRLTWDPDWGTGPAILAGSRLVQGGWQKGADQASIPQPEKVWWIDLDITPRNIWQVGADGQATRLLIARDPNWTLSNPNDPMQEWYNWDNPEWWKGKNKKDIAGKTYHWCTDTDVLRGGEDLTGATVWTQWMPVMSSPYPHPIIAHDRQAGSIAFGGPWTWTAQEGVWDHCRYYLEDKPQWLDSPGEFWFEKRGKGGRLYLRLPGDTDPNQADIEIGERLRLLAGSDVQHLQVRGLDFRYTDTYYDYAGPRWAHPDKGAATLDFSGQVVDVRIEHCHIADVSQGIRIVPQAGKNPDHVVIADNTLQRLDQGAIRVDCVLPNWGKGTPVGITQGLEILRNDIREAGMRVMAGDHGHVIQIATRNLHLAGNMLSRLGGAGINVNGGHSTENNQRAEEVPFARYLIHHNRVEDALLQSCDWGAFYQHTHAGPSYFWNNVAINPVGNRRSTDGLLGMAYYLDGGYKCYLFNNIAVGKDHLRQKPLHNENAFKSMVSFQNMFLNNTAYNWENASDRQSPAGCRELYLGNVFANIHGWVWHHNKPSDGKAAANAAHEVQATSGYRFQTMAYANNVISRANPQQPFGVFIEKGESYPSLDAMAQALRSAGAMQADIGLEVQDGILRDPDSGDFRPASGSPALGQARRAFVPWALARCVGEWQFRPRRDRPEIIEDEHWYQTSYYIDRGMYMSTPRYPLTVAGATVADFIDSPQENWIPSALRLPESATAVLSQDVITESFTHGTGREAKGPPHTVTAEEKQTVDIDTSNLLLEVLFRSSDQDGSLISKMADGVGYAVAIKGGRLVCTVQDQQGARTALPLAQEIADGAWHHVIVELDRALGLQVYLDGHVVGKAETVPSGSLRNAGNLVLGQDLAVDVDYLRIARATLAEAHTDIAELYQWQFAGPARADFTGQPRQEHSAAGALGQ